MIYLYSIGHDHGVSKGPGRRRQLPKGSHQLGQLTGGLHSYRRARQHCNGADLPRSETSAHNKWEQQTDETKTRRLTSVSSLYHLNYLFKDEILLQVKYNSCE